MDTKKLIKNSIKHIIYKLFANKFKLNENYLVTIWYYRQVLLILDFEKYKQSQSVETYSTTNFLDKVS